MDYKRNKHRREWWHAHHEEKGLTPNYFMKRRKPSHDYSSRCIYMITLETLDRRSVLGCVNGADDSHSKPWIKPTELGSKVLTCWRQITFRHPEIRLLAIQLMPDHMHGILFVTKDMKKHIGNVINGFKIGCNKISREMTGNTLWANGYNDIILKEKGQLERMVRYVQDNPRRLWVKLHNYDCFKINHNVKIGTWDVATMGNHFLLDNPLKVAVRCSRSIKTKEDIEKEVEKYLSQAQNGAVLVSAFISKAEKAVLHTALESNFRIIIILENGFSPLWKPSGKHFDACASGQLLFIAPWPHHNQEKGITREQCLQLNELAQIIASESV